MEWNHHRIELNPTWNGTKLNTEWNYPGSITYHVLVGKYLQLSDPGWWIYLYHHLLWVQTVSEEWRDGVCVYMYYMKVYGEEGV